MSPLERLVAIEEITRLKAAYFRFVDGKDWEAFATLFAVDATLALPDDDTGGVILGPTAMVETIAAALAGVTSVHHGHMGEVDVIDANHATGIWAMEDKLWWPDGRFLHGYGHYHETYVRTAHGWKYRSIVLRRLKRERRGWP